MIASPWSFRCINSMHHHYLKHVAANAGRCMRPSMHVDRTAVHSLPSRPDYCDGEGHCISRLGVRFLVSSDNLIRAVATCHWILLVLGMEAKVGFSHAVVPCSREMHTLQETMAGASDLLVLLFIRGCHDALY